MPDAVEPRIFVVDDDASIRSALRRLFESVGLACETFDEGSAFLARANQRPFGCAVLDMRLPGMSGLDVQRQLLESGNNLPVIFISAYADVPLTVRAMKAGAIDVLTKPFHDQALIDLVHAALDVARRRRREQEEIAVLRGHLDTLTSREREVMTLVASGLLNKQIAAALGTSEKTIKAHRANVMRKMQAESLAALVRMADRLGLSTRG